MILGLVRFEPTHIFATALGRKKKRIRLFPTPASLVTCIRVIIVVEAEVEKLKVDNGTGRLIPCRMWWSYFFTFIPSLPFPFRLASSLHESIGRQLGT